jgi:hypothetical protein
MSRVIEVVLPDQLVTDVQPMLVQGGMDLKDYILEAVTWYTRYLRQEPRRPGMVSWADGNAGEQALLLRRIHEELAPYSVEALQAALGEEEEDWEALLA